MLQAPQRTALSGPALIRLLARLTDADVAESSQSLSDRLSQWLGWTDAIALSSALSGAPAAVAAGARAFGSAEETECARARMSLVNAIARDSAFAAPRRGGSAQVTSHAAAQVAAQVAAQAAQADVKADYAVFRQRYQSMQQSMESGIGTLRGRLRSMLAARSPAMARLAVLDAVMDRALAPREQALLGAIPGMLAAHYERLRQFEQAALAAIESPVETSVEASIETPVEAPVKASSETVAIAPGTWLSEFRKDMQSVLLAELDVRFQPVEGLLAALRAS